MSRDFVVLLREAPSEAVVASALGAAGEELWVTGVGGLVQVWEHEGGRLLVSMGAPIHVRVPGETERLLGAEVGRVEVPVWWVDVHGAEWFEGESPAMRFAAALAMGAGGVVWTDDPAYEVTAF